MCKIILESSPPRFPIGVEFFLHLMSDTLKKRTLNALVWSFIDKCGQQLLYFISGIILANLLTPEDYGKIGFITLSGILVDSGFGSALIRKKKATETDYSTIFFFNLAISVFFYLILFFAAPLIADFFEIPSLTLIARILFISIIFQGFGLIQQVRLTKHIAFTHLARINIIAILAGSTVAIVYAYRGGGVWALVIQQLLITLLRTILLWVYGHWYPAVVFSPKSIREFLAYSSHLIGTGVLNAVYNNIYPMLIGKGYSTASVGFYTQAHRFQEIPSSLVATIFRSVAFPVLSTINDEPERMIRIFGKYIRTISFFIFPVMVLFIVIAEPLVLVLLSEKWAAAIPFLQRLCIAGAFSPFIILYYDLFNTIGRSDINLKTEIVKKILLTVGIFFCFGKGIIALIWLWVAYTLASLAASMWLGQHFTSYRATRFVRDIIPCLLLSVFAGIIAWGVFLSCTSLLGRLIAPLLVFTAVYLLGTYTARVEIWKEFFKWKTERNK